MRPYQVLLLKEKGELGAMAMKEYLLLPKAPALLGPHHQIAKCHIQDTRWVGFIPL